MPLNDSLKTRHVNISVLRSSSVRWTFALSLAQPEFCSATNHHKQNPRAVSFHIIAQPENVHYVLVFLGARTRTLNHERKAVWEVQMVLSLTPQHSDHSQGACTYRQCGPFLPWCRWHRKKNKQKKEKEAFSANTKSKHTNSGDPLSPQSIFSPVGCLLSQEDQGVFTDVWMLSYTLILVPLEMQMYTFLNVIFHPAFVLTSYMCINVSQSF